MKFENKNLLELFIAVLSIIFLGLMLFKLFLFGVIVLIIDGSFIAYYYSKLNENKNEVTKYKSNLKNILKTYDSILVEVKEIPAVDKHSIVMVTNFKDMVDAQYELRKPIYYKEYDNSCGFVLIGDKEVCVYILKLYDSVVSPVEKIIDTYTKYGIGNVEDIFDKFDKTGVIRLGNNKSYRISPVKEKKQDTIKPKFVNSFKVVDEESLVENKEQSVSNDNKVNNSISIIELPELKK